MQHCILSIIAIIGILSGFKNFWPHSHHSHHSHHLVYCSLDRESVACGQKCKVHCCNFKGFKVTNLQSSAWLGFEPTPSAWVTQHRETDSRGRPGFKSWPGQTLKICNFEALEVTAMYFTFSETSNLFLFGQERSRA